MTPQTGKTKYPRIDAAINQAIELDSCGKTLEAVDVLLALAVDFPETSSVHGYLAWYLSQLGRHEDAIEHGQQAVRLSPESERASLVHFHVLCGAGRESAAFDEMERFLKIKPSDEYTAILNRMTNKKSSDDT